MEIVDIILSKGLTGYYLDDKHAIQKDATLDGNFYFGEIVTAGFKTIRQPGESVSFMMVLDDGQISCGDCATGQYSGIGGRDAPFFADELIQFIEKKINPKLIIFVKSRKNHDFLDVLDTQKTKKEKGTGGGE